MPTFETQGGTNPGVTILAADGTVHTAHTTEGFTEAVAGSGVYNYPHPSPGTLLEFVFDATVGGDTLYASVWDDGLTPQGAAEAALIAQDVSTFDPAADTVAHVTLVDTTTTNTDMRGTDGAATPGDAMTLTAEYDHAKDDVLTPLGVVDAKVDTILAEDVGADLGTDTCTITLHDASGGVVADARVYVSSDADGLVRSDIRVTDALGQVAFDLTAGNTYYLWAFSTLVDFTAANPMSFVAAAD